MDGDGCGESQEKYPEDQIVALDLLTYAGNLENLESVDTEDTYSTSITMEA